MDGRPGEAPAGERLTPWQRLARRRILTLAGKRPGEPLTPDDWAAYFAVHVEAGWTRRLLTAIPSGPRCRICGAPFGGVGGRLLGPVGYRPSRKNPHMCASCVENSPPGGMRMDVGVLFADVRGFTALAERADPHELGRLLRRLYSSAEEVLFPEALVDKVVGDQVMALYIPALGRFGEPARLMFEHAIALLRKIGYGSAAGPFLEVAVGMDFGEAFVGNVGRRWVYDFTAVGDVVNSAFRLQSAGRGGEIVLSGAVADQLGEPVGERVELVVKGKAEPVVAHRVRIAVPPEAGLPHRRAPAAAGSSQA